MNHNRIFKQVALSALLLSAIAAPVVANAETGQTSKAIVSGQVTKLELVSALMPINLNNELELAKKYAPETVSDWETVLEKYNKITRVGELSASDSKLSAFTTAASEDKDILALHINTNIEGAQAVKIGEAHFVEGTTIIQSGVALNDIQLTAASSILPSLSKAQIELTEAVESKDWIMIKAALNQLLKEYKEEIAQIEANIGNTNLSVKGVPATVSIKK